ncbi:helix-turn-helix domain-containing protein [Bradyrhizobium sp. LHD-71]|uniref:helix-turn-helix domain-containing protein n=1 Tax=Bradyrhizobium sp. LHD-71 TaxID=3072141 RepID=UPI00280D0F0F|nr:helix-turn-helix domain-containing protein [Bradyrhizobium sp. LHD-71]MDQ8730193.1 helix-turn-helix domain-containing protein [Bradyrhizobium sp. LHD-71]
MRRLIADAEVEIVQLGRGRLDGSLTKATFPQLAFSRTDFSLPLRTSGILGTTNLTICMLLDSQGRSTSWARELRSGDVFVAAPGDNLDAVWGERSAMAGISISPQDIASMFAGEPVLSDVDYWTRNHHYACEPHLRATLATRVLEIAAWLERHTGLSTAAVDFWQRCLIEAFTSIFVRSTPRQMGETIPSALRLVRQVEEYLQLHVNRAVHISEICAMLQTSRRTLHRAFQDVLGIGPIAFLRHHRLCSVHSRLRQGDPSNTHVTDVATEFGFLEHGRFAHHYAALFGEYPSQTLYKAGMPLQRAS